MLGVVLLLLGGSMGSLQLSPILVGAAFLALLAATLIGGVEGWPTRGGRASQLPTAERMAARSAGTWPPRIGLAVVGLVTAIAVQSWFDPGPLLAGGDAVARGGHGLAGTALRSLVMVGLKSWRPCR